MEFLIANLAPIMFATLIGFLLLGFPVAFALAANGILFGLVGMELGLLNSSLFQALPQRVFGIISNDTLLAVPFFTLMGLVLERSGMAEDLLETIGQLFGTLRGGLAIAVVFVGAMLAATTGVVSASVISMGLISLPIMLRYGYDRRLASGIIAASGTLSQIIPPSLVLIILADQLGRSIGDIYRAAMVPGFILAGLYIVYIVIMSLLAGLGAGAARRGASFPGAEWRPGGRSLLVLMAISAVSAYFLGLWVENNTAPLDERIVVALLFWGATAFVIALVNKALGLGLLSALAERVTFVMIPPLALIFLVLGTIFIGVATPTEGGAMGAVGAILMAVARRRLSLDLLRQAMDTTTKLSCFVVFILVGSTVFGLTFRAVNGDLWVEHLLTGLPGGQWGFLIVVSILTFVLAFFLDFFELAFIIVPLLAGRRQAGHRPDLVRRDPGRQHADVLHASAVRLRAVLPAFGGAPRTLQGQGDGQDDRACHHRADLLGFGAVHRDPAAHGGRGDGVPGHGDALQGRRRHRRSEFRVAGSGRRRWRQRLWDGRQSVQVTGQGRASVL